MCGESTVTFPACFFFFKVELTFTKPLRPDQENNTSLSKHNPRQEIQAQT